MPGPMLEPSLLGTASCRQRTGWQLLGELEAVDLRQCRTGRGGGGLQLGTWQLQGIMVISRLPGSGPACPESPRETGCTSTKCSLLSPLSWPPQAGLLGKCGF